MRVDRPLKVALFGSGRVRQVHARNVADHSDLELAWITKPFIKSAEELAVATGARAVRTSDEIFSARSGRAVKVGQEH